MAARGGVVYRRAPSPSGGNRPRDAAGHETFSSRGTIERLEGSPPLACVTCEGRCLGLGDGSGRWAAATAGRGVFPGTLTVHMG